MLNTKSKLPCSRVSRYGKIPKQVLLGKVELYSVIPQHFSDTYFFKTF